MWRSATVEAARLLDRDDLGALEHTRRADLVAISGDVTDLGDLETRIVAVWKGGAAVSIGDGAPASERRGGPFSDPP